MKNISLVETRKKVGLTQVEVAKKARITEVSYQRIEYGTQRPSLDTAILIADALGVKSYKTFKKLFSAATLDNTKEPEGNQA